MSVGRPTPVLEAEGLSKRFGATEALVDVALEVVEEPLLAGDEVERRAGLSRGMVHVRDGDYVGNAVNTAARLTDLARPGSVLVAEDAASRFARDWVTRQLRPRKLKGLGRVRPGRGWGGGAPRRARPGGGPGGGGAREPDG
jgi:adenylate cyclase